MSNTYPRLDLHNEKLGHKRLLYIGDVPIEPSHAGSLLLWRLFEGWPPDRIGVIESSLYGRITESHLPCFHHRFNFPIRRIFSTRLHKLLSTLFIKMSRYLAIGFRKAATNFNPDAIVTVAHGYSWLAACELARDLNIPCHIVVHDDWPSFTKCQGQEVAANRFAFELSHAQTVICISDFMAAEYERRTGRRCEVLLPSRGRSATAHTRAPRTAFTRTSGLRLVYAGSVNSTEVRGQLTALGRALAEAELGKLIIYSQLLTKDIFNESGIELREMVSPDIVVRTLRQEADFVLLAMNFSNDARANMELCFPSKLVDYTASALPVIFWGPEYGSGIKWAIEELGSQYVSTCSKPDGVVSVIRRLAQNPGETSDYSRKLVSVGHKCFSYQSGMSKFGRLINGE